MTLRAYHQGGNVIVELQDDGRGIDPVKVLDKARRQGLVAAEAQLSREEIFKLIFLPGFSTAEKITSVSGRGVGMDVVKRNIEKLRGKIEVTSEVKATARSSQDQLLLTLADHRRPDRAGKVGTTASSRFSTSHSDMLRPARENTVKVQGTGEVLDWHGRLLLLHRRTAASASGGGPTSCGRGIVVTVESSGKVFALPVDDETVSKAGSSDQEPRRLPAGPERRLRRRHPGRRQHRPDPRPLGAPASRLIPTAFHPWPRPRSLPPSTRSLRAGA